MKRIKLIPIVLIIALGVAYAVCWCTRFTMDDMRRLRSESSSEVWKALKSAPDSVLPVLEKFASQKVCRMRLDASTHYIPSVTCELKVPVDVTAGLIEDAFVRFVGNGFPDDAGKVRIKGLLAFTNGFMEQCPKDDVKYIRERMLDALFVVDDFDGAAKIIEDGIPGRSESWCKCTVAKIRAHQAEARGDDAEALKQFLIFAEALATDPTREDGEFDPSSGVAYSRAWILGKTAKRCSDYFKKLGKNEESAQKLAEARTLYTQALAEAQDDEKSLAVLKAEIAAAGITPEESPAP